MMKLSNRKYQSIDEYISEFPKKTADKLTAIRNIIKRIAPGAEEAIRYNIPTFILNGNLVHFAGFNSHIGFYPTPGGISAFKNDLAEFKTSKGAIQFPLDTPLPEALIRKIVAFRVQENKSRKS